LIEALILPTFVVVVVLAITGWLLVKAMKTKPDPKLVPRDRLGQPIKLEKGGSMPVVVLLGLVLGFFGACNLLQAVGDPNTARQVGSVVIGLVLFLPGLVMFIYGLKRTGRSREQVGNTLKCPHCAEMIKPDARVCRYCKRDLVTAADGQAGGEVR
jgi:hypothetical protein